MNPDYTSKSREAEVAKSERNRALDQKNSTLSDKETKERLYNQAVKNLTAAEKAEMAAKAQTGFGFGAGGGGRGAGKGGTAKGKGGTKKSGGKKDESLFRILGRDLINEIDDIEKSLKHQKNLHKK